jgi:photosystem I subunit 3
MKFTFTNFSSKIFKTVTISTLVFSCLFGNLQSAKADYKALTPCKESKAYQKRLKSSVKKLENRLALYTPESKEHKFLEREIVATQTRFNKFADQDMLCGKEGLPRIIASGQWDRANEFVIPGVMFLYITGWIGWVGRKYLRYASTQGNKSFENEIIINVPVAIKIMNSGFLWPVDAWKEFTSGDLLADDDDVTVSPR